MEKCGICSEEFDAVHSTFCINCKHSVCCSCFEKIDKCPYCRQYYLMFSVDQLYITIESHGYTLKNHGVFRSKHDANEVYVKSVIEYLSTVVHAHVRDTDEDEDKGFLTKFRNLKCSTHKKYEYFVDNFNKNTWDKYEDGRLTWGENCFKLLYDGIVTTTITLTEVNKPYFNTEKIGLHCYPEYIGIIKPISLTGYMVCSVHVDFEKSAPQRHSSSKTYDGPNSTIRLVNYGILDKESSEKIFKKVIIEEMRIFLSDNLDYKWSTDLITSFKNEKQFEDMLEDSQKINGWCPISITERSCEFDDSRGLIFEYNRQFKFVESYNLVQRR